MSDQVGPATGGFWADSDSEQALDRYRTLVNMIDDGIYQLDPTGRFVAVNDAIVQLSGYDRDELLGEHASLVVAEEDVRHVEEEIKARLAGDGGDERIELRARTADGEMILCELEFHLLVEDGTFRGSVGVVRDITDRKQTERELREREEQLSRLIDNVPGMVYRCRNERGWPMEFVSDACEDITEYAPEMLERGDIEWGDDIMLQADRDMVWETVQRETNEGGTFSETYRIETAEEETRWVRDYGRGIFEGDDGDLVAIEGIISDITADRLTRQRLKEERDMFSEGPAIVFRWQPDAEAGWPVEYVSENVTDAFGYSPAELESGDVPYADLLLDEEMDRIASEVEEHSDGSTERFSHAPYRIRTKEGDIRWVKDTTKIVRDDDGTITNYLGYLVDITERKERERELEQYKTIIETITDGVYVVDEDGRFTMVNEAYVEMTGYEREELLGAHVSLIVDETVVERAQQTEAAMRHGDPDAPTIEAELQTSDGERLPSEATFALLPDTEGHERRVGVARDISDRKARERERREKERRYRTLAEYFPNGIVTLFDHDLRYELAAGQGFEDIPVTPEAVEGNHFEDVWDDQTVEALRPALEAALDGEEQSVELSYEDREWVVHVVPITDERGEVFAGMTMAQDITERKERKWQLADAKSRLEAATEAGAVGTWEWHIQDDEIVTGTSFAEMFGVDPKAARVGVTLDRFIDAIHEADRERVERKIEAAVEARGEYEAEYRVRNADGEIRWVFARGHVECDDDGTPIRFPGALTDITERKRAERELERNTEQLETLFEVLPVGVVVAEPDGEIVAANDTAHDIWGGDVFDADSVAEYDQYPVFRAATGERVPPEEMTLARVVDGEEVSEPDVYEIKAVDDELRIVELKGMPIRNETGEVVRGVVTMADVTDRRRTQRKLEESERRYRTLAEHFPEGTVGLFDENLEYTAMGGQLMAELGIEEDERVGESVTEIYPDDLVETLEPYFEGALAGKTNPFEVEYHDRHLYAQTLPIRDANGEVTAGMLVVQDVTERREYERKLEESNERLQQFAHAASHDLQEPLRMVSSYLQLLEGRYEDDLDAEAREFIEFAVDGAERMREMIDALLEYSRVETRGDPLEPVDLETVLSDVRGDLQLQIEESDAGIRANSLPTVEGDPTQLRQVFQNLLDNAIEYSGEEPPQVYISAERDGDKWLISVEDEGIGIDPDEQERIFEVFQRLHSREAHEGTGIGLSLCQRIIERHGGDIWVESRPDEGSTFVFTLPPADDIE